MAAAGWVQMCRRCGRSWAPADPAWLCQCGGLLDLLGPGADPIAGIQPAESLWRYRAVLPGAGDGSVWERVTLGEGMTPLAPIRPGLWAKLDYVMPTGSFKDRGAAVMMSLAAGLGVQRVVADSSGNAGIAIAAYAARAQIAVEVFVPHGTPTTRVAAMVRHGARVVVGGDRAGAAAAARGAAEVSGAWYASHVFRPAFVHGVKTLAFELWEQLGGHAPGSVVVPAGNGTLVQGLWLGFRELAAHNRVSRVPEIVAVQAGRCAPLAGLRPDGRTAASGIDIAAPPRGGQVRAAVVASRGRVVTVTEDAMQQAQAELAGMGMSVEMTAAAAWAATTSVAGPEPVAVVLTGAG